MTNPFTLTFGKNPLESVERPVQNNEILDAFTSDTINQQMFIITGVRGSGKTVMMSKICHELSKRPDWIVLELNPATGEPEAVPVLASGHKFSLFKQISQKNYA